MNLCQWHRWPRNVGCAYGQPGKILGELAIIDGLPRFASVVAVMHTIVQTMSWEGFREYMRRHPS
ncbi:MAG: hypothetical protein WAM60_04925 [Candidatus Promineifilaceae bacterium]